MFEKEKSERDKEIEKARKKMQKKAIKAQKEADMKRKEAEKILDKEYVEKALGWERKRDESFQVRRDTRIHEMEEEVLKDVGEKFECKACGTLIGLGNINCPNCGTLYCQYCGAMMDQLNPGKCPKCGGIPNYMPAQLVLTKVEDIPEEERFWDQLDNCPKCGASIQPDWDQCPICGAKLERKIAPKEEGEELSIDALKKKRKAELEERRARKRAKQEPKRGI
jgi:rubrerythrin